MALKQCSMCERTFTKLEHVRRHERSHTRERPYECPTCKKHFSRSDVLFRHCKGHAQHALNRMKNNEQPNSEHSNHEHPYRHNSVGDLHTPQPISSGNGGKRFPTRTLKPRTASRVSPTNSRRQSQLTEVGDSSQYNPRNVLASNNQQLLKPQLQKPGEDRIEALLNAAQHLGPAAETPWRSPSPMIIAHVETHGNLQKETMDPPIDPALDDLIFSPGAIDQWAFELVQSNNPVPNRTPADALQTWLFPLENDMSPPNEVHQQGVEQILDNAFPHVSPSNQPSPSGSSVSIASRVPRERFQRVQSCWPSRNHGKRRLMPYLWRDLIQTDCANIFSEVFHQATGASRSGRERRDSRWGLDEECRSVLQAALNDISQPQSIRSGSYGETVSSSAETASSPSTEGVQFPPAEILDIAFEMYLYYFHPTLPIVHMPTFSATSTSHPLLLCICLIGLSILGTAGAAKFVAQAFPAVLQLALTELQSLTMTDQPPHKQLRIIATSLLALSLASITGCKSRIAQAEKLYMELMTVAKQQGLLFVDEASDIHPLLDEIADSEEKWRAWSKIECAKRIVFGIIEADCWWASYLSASPLIPPESVQILPPSDYSLYHASSSKEWVQLIQRGAKIYSTTITPSFHPTPGLKLDSSSFRSLLTLLLLRIYESNDRLASGTGPARHLEPWRIYAEDARSRDILPLLVSLSSSSIDALRAADLNSAVMWHESCMVLGANMRYFELAAGRAGPEPAVNALEEISAWSQTASARRSVLHAAHIYKLLCDRKVSEIVNPHSVIALFHAALVLGLYIFTLPPDPSVGFHRNTVDQGYNGIDSPCIELLDLVDWISIGQHGFTSHATPLSPDYSSATAPVLAFISNGGSFSITGIAVEGGYLAARRTLLHCADLMEGMARWKSKTFSQILHIMGDDLTDYEGGVGDDITSRG